MALTIYIASIAIYISGSFITLTLCCAVATISFLIACNEASVENKKKYKKLSIISFIFAVFFMFSYSLIPSEENIYKIAGVTAQEKSAIDASGKIIANQNKN